MTSRRRALVPALMVLLSGWPTLDAQDTTRVRPDSAVRPPDSSLVSPITIPMVDPEVPPGPLPPGSRYVFTRDSLAWTRAQTLGDLLSAIPGLYLARGGFYGQPEYPAFAGRGASAVEIYWDGVPMEPLGGDSLYVDPAHIPLTYLRRIDIEVLPAVLRVYLVSERHELVEPRSVLRVMTGQFKTAGYAGLFQKRLANGFGVNLAADYLATQGNGSTARQNQAFDIWGKLEWLPRPTLGASYQLRRQRQVRDTLLATADDGGALITDRRRGTRTDQVFSFFAGTRPLGFGLRAEGGLATSAWTNDSVVPDQHLRRVFGSLRYQLPRLTAEVRAFAGDGRTTREVGGRLGWMPIQFFMISGDARLRRHEGDRIARRMHGSAALVLGPFSVVGEMATQREPEAPAILSDTLQETTDRAARIGLRTRLLSGRVGLVERDAYQPRPFPDIPIIPQFAPSTAATFLVAEATFKPRSWLTLDGWYAHPRTGSADFQPPTHGRAQITFRSKFWRTFRSGAFDLKMQVAMESWSRGTAGLDSTGTVIEMRGITFWDAYLEFQLVGFNAFWSLRNAYRARERYIPGYPYPRTAQTYGVRWEFGN